MERAAHGYDNTCFSGGYAGGGDGVGDKGNSGTVTTCRRLTKAEANDPNARSPVISATSDQLFLDYMDRRDELPTYDGELLMDVHAGGCYTSQGSDEVLQPPQRGAAGRRRARRRGGRLAGRETLRPCEAQRSVAARAVASVPRRPDGYEHRRRLPLFVERRTDLAATGYRGHDGGRRCAEPFARHAGEGYARGGLQSRDLRPARSGGG